MLNKVLKIVGIVFGSLVLLGIMAYGAMSYYFRYRFPYGTYINNVNAATFTTEQMNDYLLRNYIPGVDYSNISLLVEGRDGYSETIKCADIDLKADMTAELNRIMSDQKPYEWPVSWLYPIRYNVTPSITYDEKALREAVGKLKCVNGSEYKKKPVVRLEPDDNGYHLYDEIKDRADADRIFEMARTALDNIDKSVIEMDIEDCYIPHEIPSEYKDVISLYDKIEKLKTARITFLDDKLKYTLNGDLAVSWLQKGEDGLPFVDEKGDLVFDETRLEGYTDFLSDVFNTTGGYIDWVKHSGGTVTLKNSMPGYIVDKTAEKEKIKEQLLRGGVLKRRPLYESEGNGRGNDRVGKTYIEVDMGEQKLYYYVDGQLSMSSDVVTGNLAKGNGTPSKLCYVYFKQRNRTLRGRDYATFVNYWMAVTGHIGIHDATWRNKFGGNIYKTAGSHGCINVPKDFAGKLYEVVEVGTPCIMYY